jgi:hypothetical protein
MLNVQKKVTLTEHPSSDRVFCRSDQFIGGAVLELMPNGREHLCYRGVKSSHFTMKTAIDFNLFFVACELKSLKWPWQGIVISGLYD